MFYPCSFQIRIVMIKRWATALLAFTDEYFFNTGETLIAT